MIHHNMRDGFPLLTTKKVAFKTMATELMWFLMGDTNIKYLVGNGVHIWDGDCFANYIRNFSKYVDSLPENGEAEFIINKDKFIEKIKTDDEFAKQWGELGPVYGKQWRRWGIEWEDTESITYIDQIANLINDLKTNPDSRRLMVNAWNVGELGNMTLPPCHYGFQVYTRELTWEERINWVNENTDEYTKLKQNYFLEEVWKESTPKRAISLSWNQRSVDVFLGLPFNIASYGLLLEMIAREVNMVPEHLIGHLGDTHLYLNHLEQAEQQLERIPRELPIMKMSSGHNFRAALKGNTDEIDLNDFMLVGYNPHPTIKAPLSN
jgi:thymidylate synthase